MISLAAGASMWFLGSFFFHKSVQMMGMKVRITMRSLETDFETSGSLSTLIKFQPLFILTKAHFQLNFANSHSLSEAIVIFYRGPTYFWKTLIWHDIELMMILLKFSTEMVSSCVWFWNFCWAQRTLVNTSMLLSGLLHMSRWKIHFGPVGILSNACIMTLMQLKIMSPSTEVCVTFILCI